MWLLRVSERHFWRAKKIRNNNAIYTQCISVCNPYRQQNVSCGKLDEHKYAKNVNKIHSALSQLSTCSEFGLFYVYFLDVCSEDDFWKECNFLWQLREYRLRSLIFRRRFIFGVFIAISHHNFSFIIVAFCLLFVCQNISKTRTHDIFSFYCFSVASSLMCCCWFTINCRCLAIHTAIDKQENKQKNMKYVSNNK